jgi:carbon monoxide dehydrogenase subunit G
MSSVHLKIRIEAPIDRVWETIMDPKRFGEWVTIHRSVRNMSGDPQSEGATMDQVMHMRGINFKVRWTLEHVNPPKRAEWDGRGPAHSTARITYALTPDGDDATLFEYTNEFKTPGGRLGSVASGVIVGDASEREAHSSLERLKKLLERD